MAENGQLGAALLTATVTTPPQKLSAPAAAAWDRLNNEYRRRYGTFLRLTDSYRPYPVQERIFLQRYTTTFLAGRPFKTWRGQRWYQRAGTAMAATPGTSNHGWGNAVDVTGLGGFGGTPYKRLAAMAGFYGFNNAAGKRIKEPWHWEYTGGGLIVPTTAGMDGIWGSGTTRRLQQVLGTPVDGQVSRQNLRWRDANPGLTSGWEWVAGAGNGSALVRAMQQRLGVHADGLIGPDTIRALQRHLGTPQDGTVSKPSRMVKTLQRRLDEGRF